jgi:hypothetical protein
MYHRDIEQLDSQSQLSHALAEKGDLDRLLDLSRIAGGQLQGQTKEGIEGLLV